SRDGGFGDDHAGGIDAEIVAAVNETGQAVHHETVAVCRPDVEDHGPPRAVHISGPVVVRDDDLAVPGVAAGGDERPAVAGCGDRRQRGDLMFLVVLSHVVAPLFGTVHDYDVPQVQLAAASADSISDSLHFLAVFLIDVRPPDISRRFAEKTPILAVVMRE